MRKNKYLKQIFQASSLLVAFSTPGMLSALPTDIEDNVQILNFKENEGSLANFATVLNIFEKAKCFDCHIIGGSGEDVFLDTRAALVDSVREIVIPGDPDSSGLVISISPGARKPMPPKKPGYKPLEENEIALIREWIKKGAPND